MLISPVRSAILKASLGVVLILAILTLNADGEVSGSITASARVINPIGLRFEHGRPDAAPGFLVQYPSVHSINVVVSSELRQSTHTLGTLLDTDAAATAGFVSPNRLLQSVSPDCSECTITIIYTEN